MQSPQNSTGQKLQWWQENTSAPQTNSSQSKWYHGSMPPPHSANALTETQSDVEVTAGSQDLWEELEAEAMRRVEQEQLRRSQEWVVKGNYTQVIHRRTRRLVGLVGMLAAFYSLLALASHSWIPVYAVLVVALFAFFARQKMVRQLQKQPSMEMGVSQFGVSFDGPNFSGLLAWREIKKIDRRKISGQRFIVFHATDASVIDRLNYTPQGQRLRKAGKRWGWVARLQKLDQHAVYLPEDVLPMDAETFLNRVASFQSTALMPAR